MTKRIETAPPPTSYDRWCGEGPKRRPTKRTRSQTIIRTRDALTGLSSRRASATSPEPSTSGRPRPRRATLGATLRHPRQPPERGRRARTQAAWSFVSRVSRRVRARAGVADERGVSHLSLVRRAVHPNAEPPGVPEHRTGKRPEHRTRDTGPDRTPDLNPLTRINLQAVRGEGAPGEPTLDQVAQSPE